MSTVNNVYTTSKKLDFSLLLLHWLVSFLVNIIFALANNMVLANSMVLILIYLYLVLFANSSTSGISEKLLCTCWNKLSWRNVIILSTFPEQIKLKQITMTASQQGISTSIINKFELANTHSNNWYFNGPKDDSKLLQKLLTYDTKPFSIMADFGQMKQENVTLLIKSIKVPSGFYALIHSDLYKIYTNRNWPTFVQNKITLDVSNPLSLKPDLQGMPLRSMSLSWFPWLEIHSCDVNGRNCQTSGALHDFMNILKDFYNFTWSSDKEPNNNWGVQPNITEFSNGTRIVEYHGVLGSVVKREYDLSLSTWNHYQERMPFLDTTWSLADLEMGLIINKNKPAVDMTIFVRPFDWKSWLTVSVTFVIIVVVFLNESFYSIGAKKFTKFFLLVSGFYYLVLQGYYSGALTMFFSNSFKQPFSNLYEALNLHPTWKIISLEANEALFYNMRETKGTESLIKRIAEDKKSIFKPNQSVALEMLKEPGHFFHVGVIEVIHHLNEHEYLRYPMQIGRHFFNLEHMTYNNSFFKFIF